MAFRVFSEAHHLGSVIISRAAAMFSIIIWFHPQRVKNVISVTETTICQLAHTESYADHRNGDIMNAQID